MASNSSAATLGEHGYPRRVGPYELQLRIATGGMATVFLARKRGAGDFERSVALKLTHAHLRAQAGWAHELIEEAKLASRIRHPNVVQVLDVEDDPAGVFLVMEYIEGDTLSALFKHALRTEAVVPRDIALRILVDALQGLHAAHEVRDDSGRNAGLVHRDFTPQNILVGLDGVARLTDFGVAKAETRASFTTTGTIKGKTGYMAPEQVRGQSVDRRADVWAAGVVAWELLAGRRLHPPGEDPIATMVRAATHPPERIRDVAPDVPEALDEIVATALSLDRERRFPTAEAFRDALVMASAGELADPAIVRDYVEMVAGAKLNARRGKLAAQPAEPSVSDETSQVADVQGVRVSLAESIAPSQVVVRPRVARASVFAVVAIGGVALATFALERRFERLQPPPDAVVREAPATSLPAEIRSDQATSPPLVTQPIDSASAAVPSATTMAADVHGHNSPSHPASGHTSHHASTASSSKPDAPPSTTSTGNGEKPLAPSPYE